MRRICACGGRGLVQRLECYGRPLTSGFRAHHHPRPAGLDGVREVLAWAWATRGQGLRAAERIRGPRLSA